MVVRCCRFADELCRAGSLFPVWKGGCVMDLLRIAGLYKRFGDKEVLKGLNLAVPEHSIFGFIGKNGAGDNAIMMIVQ